MTYADQVEAEKRRVAAEFRTANQRDLAQQIEKGVADHGLDPKWLAKSSSSVDPEVLLAALQAEVNPNILAKIGLCSTRQAKPKMVAANRHLWHNVVRSQNQCSQRPDGGAGSQSHNKSKGGANPQHQSRAFRHVRGTEIHPTSTGERAYDGNNERKRIGIRDT